MLCSNRAPPSRADVGGSCSMPPCCPGQGKFSTAVSPLLSQSRVLLSATRRVKLQCALYVLADCTTRASSSNCNVTRGCVQGLQAYIRGYIARCRYKNIVQELLVAGRVRQEIKRGLDKRAAEAEAQAALANAAAGRAESGRPGRARPAEAKMVAEADVDDAAMVDAMFGFSRASMTKFAGTCFQGNADAFCCRGPLKQALLANKGSADPRKQALLAIQGKADQQAALTVWVTVLRFMGDMPEPKCGAEGPGGPQQSFAGKDVPDSRSPQAGGTVGTGAPAAGPRARHARARPARTRVAHAGVHAPCSHATANEADHQPREASLHYWPRHSPPRAPRRDLLPDLQAARP